jgi:hypothetical protein
MEELFNQLQTAHQSLEPQFKTLRQSMNALKAAMRLAAEEKADALPMQKALTKLEAAAAGVDDEGLEAAIRAFAAATQGALDDLAFDFARDLRDELTARGETVEGRPPTLAVGLLTLMIDVTARKGQWYYGKEALGRPIPLSLGGILKAHDREVKRIVNRTIDVEALVRELFQAWQDAIAKRDRRPAGGRINLVEIYAQLTLNRQNARFWNAPSRSTFKDYERPLFVRDLVILREQQSTSLSVDGELRRFRLGVATKSQAEQASRSIWLPDGALDGQFYSDITFD